MTVNRSVRKSFAETAGPRVKNPLQCLLELFFKCCGESFVDFRGKSVSLFKRISKINLP